MNKRNVLKPNRPSQVYDSILNYRLLAYDSRKLQSRKSHTRKLSLDNYFKKEDINESKKRLTNQDIIGHINSDV